MGIEITAPLATSAAEIDALLIRLGQPPLDSDDWHLSAQPEGVWRAARARHGVDVDRLMSIGGLATGGRDASLPRPGRRASTHGLNGGCWKLAARRAKLL